MDILLALLPAIAWGNILLVSVKWAVVHIAKR